MSFQSGISFNPRDRMPRPSVKSRLVSRRELGAPWRDDLTNSVRAYRQTNLAGQLQRQINQIQVLGRSPSPFHPFKIYQFPAGLRAIQSPDDWMKFKVRDGFMYTNGVGQREVPIVGTDRMSDGDTVFCPTDSDLYTQFPQSQDDGGVPSIFQIPPANGALVVEGSWNESLIPNDGSDYYFWISFLATTIAGIGFNGQPVVCYGKGASDSSPTACTEMFSGVTFDEEWPSFPFNDKYHYVVGSVWYSAAGVPVISQIIRDNPTLLFSRKSTSGMDYPATPDLAIDTYRGDYDSSTFYFYGDSISLTSGTDLYKFIYFPPNDDTAYPFYNGPISNVDPLTNNPDPWKMISKSDIS